MGVAVGVYTSGGCRDESGSAEVELYMVIGLGLGIVVVVVFNHSSGITTFNLL